MDKEKVDHLMKQVFNNWNALKRYQTKEEIARETGNIPELHEMELLKYKQMGKLELSMRALQKDIKNL